MDMVMSANNAILNTRTSVNRFSNSLDDLAESVGTAAFGILVAGAFAVSAGLGNAGLSAVARVDESFIQPLIARYTESETWTDFFEGLTNTFDFDQRSLDTASRILQSISAAYAKYRDGSTRRR